MSVDPKSPRGLERKHKRPLSSCQSQCIRCMTNVTSRQKLTWTPVSLWSLQKRNSFETRAQESQEKKQLYHHFEANVSAVWQMSRQDRAWPDSNCICDYWNTKIAQNASFKNHKKNFIIISKPMYTLYDKCHIKTKVDINPSFIVITAKTELIRDASSRITRKNFIIISKPMYPLYDKCHVKTEHDLTPIAFLMTETWKLLRTQVLCTRRKILSLIQSQCIRCMKNVTSRRKLT